MPPSDDPETMVQCLFVRKIGGALVADRRRFTLKVAPTEDMNALRETIQERFCRDEDTIELWRPKENIERGASAADRITNQLKDYTLGDLATAVDDELTVGKIMRDVRTRQSNYVHLLVEVIPRFDNPPAQHPQTVAPPDTIAFLNEKFRTLLIATSAAKSPSTNAKSVHYRDYQREAFPILDGRYAPFPQSPATQAPPIELFHPVFAEFRARAADTTTAIPVEVIRHTASFMRSASAIQTAEEKRTLPSRVSLASILGKPLVQNRNLDKTSADHVILSNTPRLNTPVAAGLAFVEEKGEMATSGDPSVQGCFSYTKFWSAEDHLSVMYNCCCPSFIIALAGPWVTILGAVTTTQHIAQRLTDYLWLGNSRVNDDEHVFRIARILYALRGSLHSLASFYESLETQPAQDGRLHPRFFPSINSYQSGNTTVEFTYKEPLERDATCVTFLATLNSPDASLVVVKFVQRYGFAVHRFLAVRGMAPELLYYGPIGGDGASYGELKMVVMEYIQGKTLAVCFDSGPIAQEVLAVVKEGINAIHADGFVYGDLRRPNVMIADAADGNTEARLGERVRFIDFDWAGKAGDVRYPLHLSAAVCTPSGASEYELIDKEHDTKMLAAL